MLNHIYLSLLALEAWRPCSIIFSVPCCHWRPSGRARSYLSLFAVIGGLAAVLDHIYLSLQALEAWRPCSIIFISLCRHWRPSGRARSSVPYLAVIGGLAAVLDHLFPTLLSLEAWRPCSIVFISLLLVEAWRPYWIVFISLLSLEAWRPCSIIFISLCWQWRPGGRARSSVPYLAVIGGLAALLDHIYLSLLSLEAVDHDLLDIWRPRETVVSVFSFVCRPVEAVSANLSDIWRLLEKPSWALSPMSGGQWRPSAMTCSTSGG